jgi:glycosyltransferase involved in cell wall biosynthesis
MRGSIAEAAVMLEDEELACSHLASGGRVIVVPHTDEASFSGARAIVAAIRREKPVVVHAHFGRPGYLGALAARALGVPRVFLTKHHESWPSISRGHAFALRVVAHAVDRVLCVSEIVLREVLAAGVPADKTAVTLFGVNAEHYGPDPDASASLRAEFGIEPETTVVLCASYLRVPKGIDVLIDAWGRLGPVASTATLLIAGDGPLESELRAQAALVDPEGIRFIGRRTDVPRLLAGADLFVCPSLSEAGGFGVIEALCAGAPVVATRTGMALSLAEKDLFVPVAAIGDAPALVSALEAALADPIGREERARRAREFVAHTMSTSERMASIAELYAPPSSAAASPEPETGEAFA